MGKSQRSKGRRGQRELSNLLTERDWEVRELNGGTAQEDFLAVDPNGKVWSVECKNTASINVRKHRTQAIRQAGKLPWLLACKIDGSSSWLIMRKAHDPVIWHRQDRPEPSD